MNSKRQQPLEGRKTDDGNREYFIHDYTGNSVGKKLGTILKQGDPTKTVYIKWID
ncbi:hypothetical protein [Xenorhabdus thailandensis]|uniref:hypothetical protein n=1 Tax=Xenorhabdus thailandensis TaxID=3136255 RepID=UPI0030F493DD